MKKISNEFTDLPDGEYHGNWTGFNLILKNKNGEDVEIHSVIGCKGINCDTVVVIKDNTIVEWKA